MMPSKLDAAAALESMDSMDALQSKPLTMIPDEMRPAFDYSGLDEQTVDDLHFAEKEYQHGKKLAERGLVHMGNAIAAAHDALCGVVQQLDNSKHGNRGDDSFRAWCCSIGITKSTAYNLLQVSALMDGSSPRQRAILEALPPTLLYAVAKPSAPAELVEKVKNGEVSTNKEYQDLLAQIKAEKERADAAEKSAQNARKENAYFKELVKSAEAQTHKDAEKREEAESRYESALADISGLKEQNAQLKERADSAEAREEEAWKMQSKAEARAHKAEDALKHQPITGVVDKDEVKRQAEALSRNAVQEARQQAAQHSVALEDARHHVRESDRRQHQRREDQHAAPAAAPPYQPEDQGVEREPHGGARNGEHHAVQGGAAVEIEGREKVVVEGIHGSMDLS